MQYEVVEEYQVEEKDAGIVLKDVDVKLTGYYSGAGFPKQLRLVTIWG